MVKCPSCGRLQEARLLCKCCEAPLGAELDFFAALGLPKRLNLDTAALARTYHDLGRRVHPDRFASRDHAVRRASLNSTALLTRSYRTLKDPVGRGLYWLELKGDKLGRNNKQVPSDIAEMVFRVQEELAELRTRQVEGDGTKDALVAEVAARRTEVAGALEESFARLQENFDRWDTDGTNGEQELVSELKAVLSKIAYLRTLLRDVDRELEHAGAS